MTRAECKRSWLVRLKNRELFCVLCGQLIESIGELSVEHEPPRSREKELGKSFIYPAHKKCNNEKGALSLDEYKEWKRLNNLRVGKTNGR